MDNTLNHVNAVYHLCLINMPRSAHTLAESKRLEVKSIDTALSRLKPTAAHFGRSPSDRQLPARRKTGVKKERLINHLYDTIRCVSEQQAAAAVIIFEKKLRHLGVRNHSGPVHGRLPDSISRPTSAACRDISQKSAIRDVTYWAVLLNVKPMPIHYNTYSLHTHNFLIVTDRMVKRQ